MNTTLAATKCNVVSLENSQNSEAEEKLLLENDKCRLLAISDVRTHVESDRVKYLPLSTVTRRTEDYPNENYGIINLIKNRVGEVVDLLMIGTEKNSYDFVKLLLTETNESNGVVICQVISSKLPKVNLLYHEPRSHEISHFFEAVRSLTMDDRYLLMRADRDRQSLHMQLFFVNHLEPYCLHRYLRMYSFD
ncbi:unnamed protein product [Strongylus vulgaris]|uniref:Uncharacterized protein n=1 Tax=Strongylus vulgaris TaxID=40348 RepID=A0A3P7LEE8_STRVU|nr:unnamed protein product [Strongylus vulgaris]